jgi:hypothetical protein
VIYRVSRLLSPSPEHKVLDCGDGSEDLAHTLPQAALLTGTESRTHGRRPQCLATANIWRRGRSVSTFFSRVRVATSTILM